MLRQRSSAGPSSNPGREAVDRHVATGRGDRAALRRVHAVVSSAGHGAAGAARRGVCRGSAWAKRGRRGRSAPSVAGSRVGAAFGGRFDRSQGLPQYQPRTG